jgi:hypothetical protein
MIYEGISQLLSGIDQQQTFIPPAITQVGKVYAVILNENTPSPELFEKYGKWEGIGTVFYKIYVDEVKLEDTIDIKDLDIKCEKAKPLFSQVKNYPLLQELIYIVEAPGVTSQITDGRSQKYYIGTINLWNNPQHNASTAGQVYVPGKTATEASNINSLYHYEGDYIIQGRKGNSIRLGTTSKDVNYPNTWSSLGNEDDTITILSSGLNFNPKSLAPYVEDINNDKSSLYLTSTQIIPISSSIKTNVIVNPIAPGKYNKGQFIGVGDRVLLNSKTDDILIIGKTDINLFSNNINLNSTNQTIIDSSQIFLGLTIDSDNLPNLDEPIMLGGRTNDMLVDLLTYLGTFASELSTAIADSTASPLLIVQAAAGSLQEKLDSLRNKISKDNYLLSDTVFTKK